MTTTLPHRQYIREKIRPVDIPRSQNDPTITCKTGFPLLGQNKFHRLYQKKIPKFI